MRTQNRLQIRAPREIIFRLAAEVELWPALLPHYRYVRVLRRAGLRRLVAMGASRDGLPVSWTSIQWLEPERHRITFRHVGGVTRGMVVEWLLEPAGDRAVDVTISHHLELGWPLIGRWAADRVVGPLFVENIAGKTLRRIKAVAEGGSLAGNR